MNKIIPIILSLAVNGAAALANGPAEGGKEFWPQWRGPEATGLARHADPPGEWSETKNIRWKTKILGKGHASPIVWGDRVYIQTAVETEKTVAPEPQAQAPAAGSDHRGRYAGPLLGSEIGSSRMVAFQPQDGQRRGRRGRRGMRRRPKPTQVYEFHVMALDRKTGKVVWDTTVCEEVPHEGLHPDSTQASNSPVTDGEHVFAHFGSRDLYCLDMQGNVVWRREFGLMKTRNNFGEGSSPALYGDTVIVTWDHEGDSYILALDKATGKERWKVERDEPTSWATPIIVEANGRPQIITSATNRVRGYDLESGDAIWECGGMTLNTIPSPVCGNGLVYAISGFRGSGLLAIDYAKAKGDITGKPAVVWTYDGGHTPYVPSPLLYDDKLYFLDVNKAILSCVDAKSGKALYNKKRLDGLDGAYASIVGAKNRVYITGRNGATAVVRHGENFELLATNVLDDGFDASAAIAGNEIYLRGREHLYCIARN